jgi:hypothetical protein
MKFSEFVNQQVDRLDAVPHFCMSDTGRKELAGWLMGVGRPWDASMDVAVAKWIVEHPGAAKIKACIDECVEFPTPPSLSDIKAVWYRLYPPACAHEKCEACGGTGWKIVNRNGVEGAARCV